MHLCSHTTATVIDAPELIHHPLKIPEGVGEHAGYPTADLWCIMLQHLFRSMTSVVRRLNAEQRSTLVLLSGNCLLDLPRKQILGPEELPGQTYDATQQCNLTFGPEYSVCPGMDVCARLWCAVVRQGQMVCLTKKLPAVEGTPCGKGRICLQGKCVDKTKKKYYSVSDFPLVPYLPVTCGDCHQKALFPRYNVFSREISLWLLLEPRGPLPVISSRRRCRPWVLLPAHACDK